MDADPAGALTTENVRELLRLSVFVAEWATKNKDQSKAYNVMQKIFRVTPPCELQSWFRCSWCSLIMYVETRGGTAPLLRHITHCEQKPANYILPEKNLHLTRRGATQASSPALESAPQSSQVVPVVKQLELPQILPATSTDSLVSQSSQVTTVQQTAELPQITKATSTEEASQSLEVIPARKALEQISPTPSTEEGSQSSQIRCVSERDDLAVAFSHISEIGMLYGKESVEEFKQILPTANGPWTPNFFKQAKRFASDRSNIRTPRVLIQRLDYLEDYIAAQKATNQQNALVLHGTCSHDVDSQMKSTSGHVNKSGGLKRKASTAAFVSTPKKSRISRTVLSSLRRSTQSRRVPQIDEDMEMASSVEYSDKGRVLKRNSTDSLIVPAMKKARTRHTTARSKTGSHVEAPQIDEVVEIASSIKHTAEGSVLKQSLMATATFPTPKRDDDLQIDTDIEMSSITEPVTKIRASKRKTRRN